MKEIYVVFGMIFCHIVDDYYLQGILASMKQREWWEKNNPDPMYRNDYIAALLAHGFSWTFMIHVPIVVYAVISRFTINPVLFLAVFLVNWPIHTITDDYKANKHTINLMQDQTIHFVQITVTCMIYAMLCFK